MDQILNELRDSFYARKRTELVPFVIGDPIEIISGQYSGEAGYVISLEAIKPEVIFLVELGSNGQDVMLPVSSLRLGG